VWSWFAGTEKPGVFEIDWQEHEGISRIAMALECRQVAVLDVNKLEAFCSTELPTGRIEDA
jgi:transducin (beta)-like 1